jgi:hypothetical protein
MLVENDFLVTNFVIFLPKFFFKILEILKRVNSTKNDF